MLVFVLGLAPLVVMAAYVGAAAVWRIPPPTDVAWLFVPLGGWFFVALFGALVLLFWQSLLVRATGRRPAMPQPAWTAPRQFAADHSRCGSADLGRVVRRRLGATAKSDPGAESRLLVRGVGSAVSYAVPVLSIAAVLVGYAIRERSGRFALAGGLTTNLGATAGYLLKVAASGLVFDWMQWTRLAQLNAIVSAIYAAAWLVALVWQARRQHRKVDFVGSELLVTQVALPGAINLLVLGAAWCAIFGYPALGVELAPFADAWGWTAALLTTALTMGIGYVGHWPRNVDRRVIPALGLLTLVACWAGDHYAALWAAYHTLLGLQVGMVAAMAIVYAALPRFFPRWATRVTQTIEPNELPAEGTFATEVDWRQHVTTRAIAMSALAVLLALRDWWGDAWACYWTAIPLVTVAALLVWFAVWSLRRGLLHGAAALLTLGAWSCWMFVRFGNQRGPHDIVSLISCELQIAVIALALPAVLWTLLELRVFRPAGTLATRVWMPMHRLAAWLGLALMLLLIALGKLADVEGMPLTDLIVDQWLAVAAVVVAAGACLWDREARERVALVYVAGFASLGVLLDSLDVVGRQFWWMGTIGLAAYGLGTSFLWSRRRGLAAGGDLLRIPRGVETPFAGLPWLVPCNVAIALAVVGLAFAAQFRFDDWQMRFLVAEAALMQAVSVGLLARGERRSQLQFAALALGAIGSVAVGWSALDPSTTGTSLNRAVVTMAALSLVAVVYGLGLSKLLAAGSEWLAAARRILPLLIGAIVLSLAGVLTTEVVLAVTGQDLVMAPAAIAVVAATLVGLCLAGLAAAVLPGRDPLGLSEGGRKLYVYAAEVLLGLTFMHIRLTMPWLFSGFFAQYWPLVVMGIAFVGAGVGELLRRQGLTVLGEPVENTGAVAVAAGPRLLDGAHGSGRLFAAAIGRGRAVYGAVDHAAGRSALACWRRWPRRAACGICLTVGTAIASSTIRRCG